MLGLRRFQTNQIDIWQGDARFFEVDHAAVLAESKDLSVWHATLQEFLNSGKRHAGFTVTQVDLAHSILMETKTLLAAAIPSSAFPLRRLTFIAPNTEIYDALQEALFSIFEDDAHGTTKT